MSLLRVVVSNFVALRAMHALVHLLMPFEVLESTHEGLRGCTPQQITNAACVYSTSAFAQGAVLELGWAIVLFNWNGSLRTRALLFAALSLLVAAVDAWSAHGADIDVAASIEVQFSEKLALIASALAMLVFRYPETYKETVQENPTLIYQANDIFFLICCGLKLTTSFAAVIDPLTAANVSAVTTWSKTDKFLLARMIAVGNSHGAAMAVTLAMLPAQERAGFQSYMLLATSQTFIYMIDASIAGRMPATLEIHNTLGGHGFLIAMYVSGLFLLFLTWRQDGYRLPNARERAYASPQAAPATGAAQASAPNTKKD